MRGAVCGAVGGGGVQWHGDRHGPLRGVRLLLPALNSSWFTVVVVTVTRLVNRTVAFIHAIIPT